MKGMEEIDLCVIHEENVDAVCDQCLVCLCKVCQFQNSHVNHADHIVSKKQLKKKIEPLISKFLPDNIKKAQRLFNGRGQNQVSPVA